MQNENKIHWVRWDKMSMAKNEGGMGFRNIRCFNLALLAKQGWRILQNPSSLCARVLKAKYFPRYDFLDSGVGYRPSFFWRSVQEAKLIIAKGMSWRVGNGVDIRVWKDNWLLDSPSSKPLVQKILPEDARVNSLIDDELKCWKRNLVKEVFLPFEVKYIMRIPLSFRLPPDFCFWKLEKNGLFSVRSGYHLARSLFGDSTGNPSTSTGPHVGWKVLWKVDAAPKIKHFLWKFLSGTLPTLDAVSKRGVQCNPHCPRCKMGIESCSHVFKECPWVKGIWLLSPLGFRSMELMDLSMLD